MPVRWETSKAIGPLQENNAPWVASLLMVAPSFVAVDLAVALGEHQCYSSNLELYSKFEVIKKLLLDWPIT